jgi:FkbM family methyltransferase
MRLDPMTLMRAVGHSCGVCGDCNDATAPLIGDFPAKRRGEESPSIRVYSFDGSTLNAQNLRQGIAALASNHSFNGLAKMWTSENAALAETYVAGATVKFVSQREVGHIASADEDLAGKTVVIVPVLTIDAIVERERLGFVDVIKVDTEGFDPLVLRGGRVTLQAHKTVLLLFEYHFVWPNTTSLKQTTRELQDWGYVCYLEGQRTLLKLTHDCWADELEVRSWSNVWCLSTRRRQGLAIASVFDTLCQGFED